MPPTDIYWQGHRVGSVCLMTAPTKIHTRSEFVLVQITRVNIPDNITIQTISQLCICFDASFAELRGITGVDLEPSETEEVKEEIARWLGQKE